MFDHEHSVVQRDGGRTIGRSDGYLVRWSEGRTVARSDFGDNRSIEGPSIEDGESTIKHCKHRNVNYVRPSTFQESCILVLLDMISTEFMLFDHLV